MYTISQFSAAAAAQRMKATTKKLRKKHLLTLNPNRHLILVFPIYFLVFCSFPDLHSQIDSLCMWMGKTRRHTEIKKNESMNWKLDRKWISGFFLCVSFIQRNLKRLQPISEIGWIEWCTNAFVTHTVRCSNYLKSVENCFGCCLSTIPGFPIY